MIKAFSEFVSELNPILDINW